MVQSHQGRQSFAENGNGRKRERIEMEEKVKQGLTFPFFFPHSILIMIVATNQPGHPILYPSLLLMYCTQVRQDQFFLSFSCYLIIFTSSPPIIAAVTFAFSSYYLLLLLHSFSDSCVDSFFSTHCFLIVIVFLHFCIFQL